MNARTKLSSKGQIVVPKEIRDSQGWAEGTEVEFLAKGNEVILRAVDDIEKRFPPVSMEEFLAGAIKVDRFPTDAEIEDTLLAEAARRFDATRR